MSIAQMEERLKLLKQTVEDEKKGRNTNSEKFEILWDLSAIIEKTPKVLFSLFHFLSYSGGCSEVCSRLSFFIE